jgi:hypothetical protein
MRRILPRLLLLVVALASAACGGTAATPSASGSGPAATPTAAVATPPVAPSATPSVGPATSPAPSVPDNTVWLCRPGLVDDPCFGDINATVVNSRGATNLEPASPAKDPPIDCFYVYPTVSRQTSTNATLTIDPQERAVAVAQAARFSQVCNVYAPMYQQLTLAAIAKPSSVNFVSAVLAYQGVVSAFDDYMANYNHGRGIVFIGHSQGAFMLTALLKAEVDTKPEVRRLLVSALLLGANVTVPIGKTVGGDFASIPACSSTTQVGCVVAYSSFDTAPPPDALFGRTNSVLNIFGSDTSGSMQVLCVNPAAPGGGRAALTPYLPTQDLSTLLGTGAPKASLSAKTPFVTYPGEFSAECKTSGGATWLQIDRTTSATDHRPGISGIGNPTWGLHVLDVNIALGNLVDLVRSETAAFHG